MLNSAPRSRTGQPISVGSLKVYVLAAGQEFNLRTRRLLGALDTPPEPTEHPERQPFKARALPDELTA
jgi:hypothetical protein